ncbi:MAG: YraN family protein [Frankia sp.]|nr:YraN family protein [Frankia sp.]
MRAKDVLGRFGEELAAGHLAAAGVEILDRNWRCRYGEIDIVALDRGTLVFCEVKTRSGDQFGTPAAAVTPRKAARLRHLAARWLAEHPGRRGPVRFDVLAVRRDPSGGEAVRVEHRRGAF